MENTDYKNIILLLILFSFSLFLYYTNDVYIIDFFTDHSNLDKQFSKNMNNSIVENSKYQLNSEFIDKFKHDKNKQPKNDYSYQVNDPNVIDESEDIDTGVDEEDIDMGSDDEDIDMGVDEEDIDMGVDEEGLPGPDKNTNAGSLEEFYTNFGENFQTYSY